MKKTILVFTICIIFVLGSCNSKTKKKDLIQDNKIKEKKMTNLKPFDLLNLSLNENIQDVLKSANYDLNDNEETDAFTVFTYKKFETSSPKFLIIDEKKFNNKTEKLTNNLILHYSEENNIVAMCQVSLYTLPEITRILSTLNNRMGKPSYNSEKSGNIQDVVNGQTVDTKIKYDEKVYLWKYNGLFYFCTNKLVQNKKLEYELKLFILKNDPEWINFIGSFGSPYIGDAIK